jgi:hypothetical protein
MASTLTCYINNQTQWTLGIQQQQQTIQDIDSQGTWQTDIEPDVLWQFVFRDSQGQTQLQGSLVVNAAEGVRMDRGHMPGEQQTVTLGAVLQPQGLYTQSQNGGEQVLPPEQLAQLESISMTWLQDDPA